MLKISSTKQSLDNIRYESNPHYADFGDFSFDGDERLITIRQLYFINEKIVFSYINGSIFYVYTNRM